MRSSASLSFWCWCVAAARHGRFGGDSVSLAQAQSITVWGARCVLRGHPDKTLALFRLS